MISEKARLATAFAARRTGEGYAPSGNHLSKMAARSGLSGRVRFEVADGAALPFADASADRIISTLSMHHWEHKVAVLAELARVVRPGGEIRIYDVWRPELLAAAEGLPLTVRVEPMAAWVGPLPLPGFRRYTLARS